MMKSKNCTILSERNTKLTMKKYVLTLLLFAPTITNGQKIFSVDYPSQADLKVYVTKYEYQADLKVYKLEYNSRFSENNGKWYFTKYPNQAMKKIYFVENENQADLKIFFVRYDYQSGWIKKKKQYLLY